MSDQLDAEYEALVARFARGLHLPAMATRAAPVDMDALVADMVAPIAANPCAKTTAAHRRWARFWGAFAVTTLTVGVAGDTAAYVGWGYPATLTCTIRRAMGIHPRTRYARAGQVVLGTALGWALIHLVTGTLGPSRGRELV